MSSLCFVSTIKTFYTIPVVITNHVYIQSEEHEWVGKYFQCWRSFKTENILKHKWSYIKYSCKF